MLVKNNVIVRILRILSGVTVILIIVSSKDTVLADFCFFEKMISFLLYYGIFGTISVCFIILLGLTLSVIDISFFLFSTIRYIVGTFFFKIFFNPITYETRKSSFFFFTPGIRYTAYTLTRCVVLGTTATCAVAGAATIIGGVGLTLDSHLQDYGIAPVFHCFIRPVGTYILFDVFDMPITKKFSNVSSNYQDLHFFDPEKSRLYRLGFRLQYISAAYEKHMERRYNYQQGVIEDVPKFSFSKAWESSKQKLAVTSMEDVD